MKDFFIEFCLAMMDLKPDDKLIWDKVAALMQAQSIIHHYASQGFDSKRLIRPIAEKKIRFIKEAATKRTLAEILKPPKPYYNGNKIVPNGDYHIPEEELVIWGILSLSHLFIHPANERMFELMRQIYPEFEALR